MSLDFVSQLLKGILHRYRMNSPTNRNIEKALPRNRYSLISPGRCKLGTCFSLSDNRGLLKYKKMTWRKACHIKTKWQESRGLTCVCVHTHRALHMCAQAPGSYTCVYGDTVWAYCLRSEGSGKCAGDAFSHTKRQLEKLFKLHFHKGSPKPAGLLIGMRNKWQTPSR